MNEAAIVDLEHLLRPVSPEKPGGDDVTFEPVFDQIRDARTQDDPRLATGAWSRELKLADWPRVEELATRTLAEQSKHLQIACWLTEALVHRHGFAGLEAGLEVMAGLLRERWDDLHPAADDGDFEPRANCVGWLNGNMARLVRTQPLTAEGRAWFDWRDALDVDNAALRDKNAKAALLDEGKIDGETWRKQVAATPSETYARADHELRGCRRAFDALDALVDQRFGADAPSLGELDQAIREVHQLVAEIAAERGIAVAPEPAPEPTPEPPPEPSPAAEETAPSDDAPAAARSADAPVAGAASGISGGAPQTRDDALRRLREIAEFFRRTEPHSPVAYMLDRAIRWANMPLDMWLQEVVKDPHTLSMLNETLGIDQGGGANEE